MPPSFEQLSGQAWNNPAILQAFIYGPGKIINDYNAGSHTGALDYGLDICEGDKCSASNYNDMVYAPTDIKLALSTYGYGMPTSSKDYHLFEVTSDLGGKLCLAMGHFAITNSSFTVGKTIPRQAQIGRIINYTPSINHIHMNLYSVPINQGCEGGNRTAVPFDGTRTDLRGQSLDGVDFHIGTSYVGTAITSHLYGMCAIATSLGIDNQAVDFELTSMGETGCDGGGLPPPTATPPPTTPPPTEPPTTNGIEIVSVSSHTVQPGEKFNPSVTIRVASGYLDPARGDHLHAVPENQSNTMSAWPVQAVKSYVSAGQTYTFNVSNDSGFQMTAPSTPGIYQSVWQMRVGGNHIGPQAIININVQGPNHAPSSPTANTPGDWSEIRSVQAPELCWSAVSDPDGDPVQYYAEIYQSAVLDNSGWISGTCWRPTNISGQYFGYQWHVKARDNRGGESGYGNTNHFTLSPPPYDPQQPTSTPPAVSTLPVQTGYSWNSSYLYRRPLTITTNSDLKAGMLIKVDGMDLETLVAAGKMRADHNDLRIVRRLSATTWQEVPRNYYSGWDVEFPLLSDIYPGTDTSYYLYYGNPNAGAPPTFTLASGWYVDMYRDKWWSSWGGTWEYNQAMDFGDVCGSPLNHSSRLSSSFDDSDKFRGRLYVPTTGTWTFRVYTNDGYRLYLDDAEVGRFDGYDGNRWSTIGSMYLKAGWHKMDARNMWVNCGAWKLSMSGPGFADQIIPSNYFQKSWGNVKTGVNLLAEESTVPVTSTPTPPSAPTLIAPVNNITVGRYDLVTLSWNAASGAMQYYAEFWGDSGLSVNSGWTSSLSYAVGSTFWGGTYQWRVKSRNSSSVESAWSETRTLIRTYGSPSSLTATATGSQVNLSWSASADAPGNIQGYRIYRDETAIGTVNSSTTTYQDTGATCGGSYSYMVKAYKGSLESGVSNTAAITVCPPANDPFITPTIINNVPYVKTQDTWTATTAGTDPIPSCGVGQNSNSVWYKYTPTANGILHVDTFGSNYDTLVAIWTGSISNLVEKGCNDDSYGELQSWLEIPVTAGTAYYIEVMDWNTPGGGNLYLYVDFAQATYNNDFNTPTVINTLPYSVTQDTRGATKANDDPTLTSCNRLPGQASVWYRYTPSANANLLIDTKGSDYDTMLAVWTGSRGSLVSVGCNDDIGDVNGIWDPDSILSVPVSAGTTYYIEASTYAGKIDVNGASVEELQDKPDNNDASASSLQDMKAEIDKNGGLITGLQSERSDEMSAQFWGGTLKLHVSPLYTITGNAGTADVVLSYIDGTATTVTTDGSGNYTITVPQGWSGTVTPYKSGYQFAPTSRTYNNVQSNQTGQNYATQACEDCAEVNVTIGGEPMGGYTLAPSESKRESYTGINSGPAQVINSSGDLTLASQRVIFGNQSYSEMMGYPNNQLTNEYVFPYYNNVAMDSQLRVSNLGNVPTQIKVYLGSDPTPIDSYILGAGGATRKNYPGKNSGPLRVTSSVTDILSTIRVLYGGESLSELMGFPADQVASAYWYPVYDNVNVDMQLRVSNVGGVPTTITVFAAGVQIDTYALGAGGATRKNYTGLNTGPLHVISSASAILTTQRLLYVTPTFGSFYELTGLPDDQLTTQYWFPWYNNSAMSSQIRIAVP